MCSLLSILSWCDINFLWWGWWFSLELVLVCFSQALVWIGIPGVSAYLVSPLVSSIHSLRFECYLLIMTNLTCHFSVCQYFCF